MNEKHLQHHNQSINKVNDKVLKDYEHVQNYLSGVNESGHDRSRIQDWISELDTGFFGHDVNLDDDAVADRLACQALGYVDLSSQSSCAASPSSTLSEIDRSNLAQELGSSIGDVDTASS
jgi:hypothetical protein